MENPKARPIRQTRKETADGQPIENKISTIDGMTMVYVPAGEFIMGSDDGDSDEKPARKVYLDPYWIDQTPVTNAMYVKFLNEKGNLVVEEENPGIYSRIKNVKGIWQVERKFTDHPVVGVSWYGAQAYCQFVGRRLPTEAEWEKAARGTDGRTYPWGDEEPNPNLGNYGGNIGDTTAVGSYPQGASPYGALDMAGNVCEWVADWYKEDYYSQSPNTNPQGPFSGQYRVMRGGSWGSIGRLLRAAVRYWYDPTNSYVVSGFRCALTP